MKTKKEIEKELEARWRKFLGNALPESKEARIEASYDKGYIDALEWVLGKD